MFRKSRIKIVAAMMSVLILLFIGMLSVIYYSSYIDVYQRDQNMLNRYAQAYWENGNPTEIMEPLPNPPADNASGERVFRLLSFHSVAFSETGEVISIDNDTRMGISDEELIALSEHLLLNRKANGVYGSWVYHTESNNGCTLVVLMDNMIMRHNMGTLLRYTVLFGSITILLLFLMSFYFARGIVRPLEESYQKQKQFISDAGHELKTPIAVISTNAELLEREFGQSKWLDNVKFETGRMADLVRQLLNLAKAESAEPQMDQLNFSRIVTGGILPFESIAFEKERELKTAIQDDIYVWGNAEQLGNLVSILVDNALEYAPKHSVISIALTSERNRAFLSVSNEGMAIPEEQRKNLFDRFYRGDSSRNSESAHYGLGLAIAKTIVTTHHGKIEVNCKMNQVTFTVSIPMNS